MGKEQMSKRERLLAALHHQPVDRLPWAPLIDDYFISSLPAQGISMEIIEAMRYIGNDILERHVAPAKPSYRNVTLRTEEHNGATRYYYDTPVGSIYYERRSSGGTSFISKHLIETIEDAKIYQYVSEHTDFIPQIEEFRQRDAYIGDDGLATAEGPTSPIQLLLQYHCGVENTVYLMFDYPDEMDELLQSMHETNLREYQALQDYPAAVVFDYEDTSTTVMSRSMYEEYSAPMIDEYTKLMHQSDKVFITHMCGKLSGFADLIGNGIQDGIDSVCPPNTGDFYAWDARKQWGKNKIIIGGLDPSAFSRMTAEESVARAKEILTKMPDLQGFIYSTGDAVAHGTPIENLKAITDYIAEFGRF